MSEPTLADVADLLRAVNERLEQIESRLDGLENQDVPDDVVIVICAAVAAYLGHKAKVKAIHFSRPGSWAQQGRQAVQSRAVSPLR